MKANKRRAGQDGRVSDDDPTVATPIFPDLLVETIIARIPLGERALVVIDGADAAAPVEFAGRVRDRIRSGARACEVIDLHDFVRPASLRFEYSRTDELSYRTSWFDFDALGREVLAPMLPGGRDSFLPRLWDESSDRSARARLEVAAPDQVLIVAGPTLLGRIGNAAVTVHLSLSAGALRRRTPTDQQWTIDPLVEYYSNADTRPDLLVRWDHPDRPALMGSLP